MKKLSSPKGFTLIELLVVIAVLGVLAAGVFAAINPLQRINQANDARAKNDLGQIVQAIQSYYTNGNPPVYPAALTDLTPNDLKVVPSAPSGYTYTYRVSSGQAILYTTLKAITTNTVYCWDDSLGGFKATTDPSNAQRCP